MQSMHSLLGPDFHFSKLCWCNELVKQGNVLITKPVVTKLRMFSRLDLNMFKEVSSLLSCCLGFLKISLMIYMEFNFMALSV